MPMKTIVKNLLVVVVLSLVPATHVCAQWKYLGEFKDGLARVRDANENWGFIDKTGKVVIPCKWFDAGSFSEGLAPVLDFTVFKRGFTRWSFPVSGNLLMISVKEWLG